MSRSDASPRSVAETLERKQRKHEELLARVERTAARLERRKAKLLEIEASLAELEHQVSGPRRKMKLKGAMDQTFREAHLIFNPTSGKDEQNGAMRLAQIVSELRLHGMAVTIGVKTSGKAARELARDAVRARSPLLVVAAGDGTIEDVVPQLLGSATVLGIVPIGTMNNIARSLGVPIDIEQACALIGMGATRHIDVGRMVTSDDPQAEYFVEGAGVGLSALAAFVGQGVEKRRWGMLPHLFRRYFDSRPDTVRVAMDGLVIEAASHVVTVSNAPMMGNNLLVAPEAKLDDGMLDVRVYDGMNEGTLVKHFVAMSAGHDGSSKIPSYRARHVTITANKPAPANADKEITAQRTTIEIEVLPRVLSVIAGNGIGLTVPVESMPAIAERAPARVTPEPNGKAPEPPAVPKAPATP